MDEKQEHPIFYTDPSEWMNYIGKEVCVTIETGESHTGWVYTVDPVSQSVVLVRFNNDDDKINVKVVMGHAVQSIVVSRFIYLMLLSYTLLYISQPVQSRVIFRKCWDLGSVAVSLPQRKQTTPDRRN